MAKDGTGRVLPDHQRIGRKLVPPLMRIAGKRMSPYSWTRQLVPETLWIWLLIESYGVNDGARLADAIGDAAASASGTDHKPFFCKATSFAPLTGEQKAAVIDTLGRDRIDRINEALVSYFELLPDSGLSFLATHQEPDAESRAAFSSSLVSLYDRFGRPAALTLATVTWMQLQQDKLRVSAHLWDKFVEDFENIADYPNTERSKAAAASFRAGAPMTLMMGDDGSFEMNEAWQQYFWNRVGTMGPCISSIPSENDEEVPDDPLGYVVFSYRNAARRELQDRIDAWGFDLHNIEVSEVVAALLSRQASLALDLALAPATWNPQTAPLITRAMADVFITLAWILAGDTKARAARFVEDGLGAVKLEIAHRKKALENQETTNDDLGREYIDHLQSWLDSQRIEHLVEVNLGSWSGLSTRAMAEEAGYLDFYNYVYQPFSSAVHSTWFHVGRLNVVPCENPAHRGHKMGHLTALPSDPYWLWLAAKYFDKTLRLFDDKTGVAVSSPSSFDMVTDLINHAGVNEGEVSGDGSA